MTDDGTLPELTPPNFDAFGETHADAPVVPGYDLLPEIARGGMGVVYRARDRAFGREVAVKVMLPGMSAAEFVREARITARLPHPGIPPVHALGTLPDGRPFLAMKLIRGDTLDKVLKARTDLSADRGKLLAAFEQMCQAVGYAHAQGVVHRDLKPANVMVGAFGEVQVMDWGLAKAVVAAEPEPAANAGATTPEGVATTAAGAIKGTPAYMAPEQARGETVDARADVFALGGILAAILTGYPPFVGNGVMDTLIRAAQAELDDTFGRLDACGADSDLIALCRQCLAADRNTRPTNGADLAAAVSAYRAAVEARLRRAEREQVAAGVRQLEQRKRRAVQLALGLAVLLLAGAGGGFAWWQDKQASERELAEQRSAGERRAAEARADAEAEYKGRQARQGVDAGLKLAADLRKQYKFKDAAAALAQAAELAKGAPERLVEVRLAERDLAFVVRLDDIRYRKWLWVAEEGGGGHFNSESTSPQYTAAFREYGLDLTTLTPDEAATRIAASGVKAEVVAAVDDWAAHEDYKLRRRLHEVLRRADPDPWADRLRDRNVRVRTSAVERLADEADVRKLTPSILVALAQLMEGHLLDPSQLLTRARLAHPADFELAFTLARCVGEKHADRLAALEAARALRPDNVPTLISLGGALCVKGDVSAAVAVYRRALELEPTLAIAYHNLAVCLGKAGDRDGAVSAFRRSIELDPKYAAAHYHLGLALGAAGDREGAVAGCRRAIELGSKNPKVHFSLGVLLYDTGDVAGAIEAYRAALAVDPKQPDVHNNLGIALRAAGDLDGSVESHRRAIELTPEDACAHTNLGNVLKDKGDLRGAVSAYRRAIELNPRFAPAHTGLGAVHLRRREYDDCAACAQAAIKANPSSPNAYALLGTALQATGDLPGARSALTQAARLDPERWGPDLAKLPPELPVAPPPRPASSQQP